MNNCSICGFGVAWCVDKEDKGTYWLCGRCAVDYYREKIESERKLVRVARAAKPVLLNIPHGQSLSSTEEAQIRVLAKALKELPEGIID